MGLREETRRIRLQEWNKIIQDRLESGMTINKYCQVHNISRDAYMYWLRQLRACEIMHKDCMFTELVVPDADPQILTDIPSPITITIGKGTITVQDKESLHMVMEVLLNAQLIIS